VLQHLQGLCHTYVDGAADPEMARRIVLNAKMRRTGVCGATETLLIDRRALGFAAAIIDDLVKAGCEVRGDDAALQLHGKVKPARAEDWDTEYLDAITLDEDADDDHGEGMAPGSMDAEESGDLYDRAVAIVLRDRKCSTSYIQRRLSVGYNKAASLVERMEREGVVGAPNHSGKREILVGGGVDRGAFELGPND
jgi:hypothetical protein